MEHTDIVEDCGIVKAVNGKQISVEIERSGGCKGCQMRGFCFSKNTPSQFVITSELSLQPGDIVQLEISPAARAMASLLIFGLPLLFLFAGFILASKWLNELSSIFIGFAAMAVSFGLVRFVDSKYGKKMDIRIAGKI